MIRSSQRTQDYSAIVLNLITFIVSDEERFERFQTLSGISIEDLKSRASDPKFHIFVLDYALQDESLILQFCATENLSPTIIQSAHHALSGPTHDF